MKKIDRVAIIGSGEDYSQIKMSPMLSQCDYIIAADGGLNLLDRLNITPDCIIGDMDSVESDILSRYGHIERFPFPTDKESTDSELALQHALTLKPVTVLLFAMTGSFFDHSLANTALLVKYKKTANNIEIITANARIFLIKKRNEFQTKTGQRFSLFPLSKCCGFRMNGCRWHYSKSELLPLDNSISNEATNDNLSMHLHSGTILMVLFDMEQK